MSDSDTIYLIKRCAELELSASRYDWLREHVKRLFDSNASPEQVDEMIDSSKAEWELEGPSMWLGKPTESASPGWKG